jgi:hypothetical protein
MRMLFSVCFVRFLNWKDSAPDLTNLSAKEISYFTVIEQSFRMIFRWSLRLYWFSVRSK